MRIGQGFDVHAFAPNRKLVLGGIEISYHQGLLGHSDADVLLHAVMDAMLGALALGDIGHHFPDTDVRYRGADSVVLAKTVWGMVRDCGYRLGNLDVMVLAQAPKIAPYITAMRQRVANCFDANLSQVSIKATTMEKMGFVGREEGMAAMAVVLLIPNEGV